MDVKAELMDAAAITRAVTRITHEILERNKGTGDLCLIGIHRRGVPLAERIAAGIKSIEGVNIPVGTLDITFYRDDLSLLGVHPSVKGTDIGFDLTGKRVVVVDDVLYTARTARAALDALMDMGRAAQIQLAVLIDRGHRELPIRADFVGKNVPTARSEIVHVLVEPIDGQERVVLCEREEKA